ncbi:MAG: hypothetical protein K0S71_2150 [Clostridia bacterium]|jgi:galactose mutarotase-like enzyme|nr:hypothetical protein [Clostridia bacterium]
MAQLYNKEISKKELLKKIGNIEQVASIKPFEMSEGRAKGIKAFDVSNGGGLDFTVLESKCLDLLNMKYKGINLSFLSKPGLVAPEYFNPAEGEFLRYFQGGMLYTCGLSNIGVPCKDGDEAHSLHGRISHTPAEKVSIVSEWQDEDYIMKLTGEMREAAHFKENLVLKREIMTKLGSKSVEIHDIVENQGQEEQPVMLLYHFNFGYPLLDEKSRVVVPKNKILPRTEIAKQNIIDFEKMSEPIDQFNEHVFYIESESDDNGDTYAALINDELGLGVYVKYNVKQLPILVEWKSMASGDYALGLEPGNHYLEGRDAERKNGTLKTLGPFEKMAFDVEIGVLEGKKDIEAFEQKLKELK